MKVTLLGTGTSTGVPVPGCECRVCTSGNSKNNRLRTSALIEHEGTTLLIDTSTDLRQQALRLGYRDLDAVFYTHAHADHIMGIDDLRGFNFRMQREIPVFADDPTATKLEQMFTYAFFEDPDYLGGAPPRLSLRRIKPFEKIAIGALVVQGIPILHGNQQILGFRIGPFAYLTDCSAIPDESKVALQNLEVLILSGLRHRLHPTHFTVSQAIEAIELLAPKRAFLTHVSHELDHDETNRFIAERTERDVHLAFDGLELELSGDEV